MTKQTVDPHLRLPAQSPRANLVATLRDKTLRCDVNRPVTLLGSRRDCPLCLDDPNVSAVHCAVVNTGAELLVLDLCSRGGVRVNGARVDVAVLRPGDKLQLGPLHVDIEFEGNQLPQPMRAALPLSITMRGERIEPSAWPYLIGRRKTCHLVIDTPDVSLAHALIFMLDGVPVIFDVGSRSGVFCNGHRVTLAELSDADQITIGGEKLSVERTDVKVKVERTTTQPAATITPNPTAPRLSIPTPTRAPIAPLAAASGPSARPPVTDPRRIEEELLAFQTQFAELWERLRGFGEALVVEESRAGRLSAELLRREAALADREAEIVTRLAAIEAREQETAAREAAMTLKQAADETLSRQLARFRSVLQETNDVLEAQPAGSAPTAPTQPAVLPPSRPTPAAGVWSAQPNVPALPVERPLFQTPDAPRTNKKNVQ